MEILIILVLKQRKEISASKGTRRLGETFDIFSHLTHEKTMVHSELYLAQRKRIRKKIENGLISKKKSAINRA